jgi:flagella basal body P-ring formation protein FlgA
MSSPARLLLAILAAACAAAGARAAGPQPTIELRAKARAAGATIVLGDIAELRGVADTQRASLARIAIAAAPRPGQQAFIGRAQVANALGAAWALAGAPVVEVERDTQPVSAQTLCDAALAAADRTLPTTRGGITRELDCTEAGLPPVEVPAGHLVLRPAEGTLAEAVDGPRRLGIDIEVDGRVERTVGVALRVGLLAGRWCARAALAEGEAITAAAFAACRVPVRHASDLATAGAALPQGRLRKALRATQPLAADDVASPEAALAGDAVTVRMHAGAFELESAGTLQQDARVGDRVRVRVGQAAQPVLGRLTSDRLVELE